MISNLHLWQMLNEHRLSFKYHIIYTGKTLGECHKFVSEKASRGGAIVGYEDIGAEAFGALGRAIVSVSMYIELLGTCALLFILEVSNISVTSWALSIWYWVDLKAPQGSAGIREQSNYACVC